MEKKFNGCSLIEHGAKDLPLDSTPVGLRKYIILQYATCRENQ